VEIDTSLPALRVLEMLRDTYTLPKAIGTDNGPEFISEELEDWCNKHHVQIQYMQPGKPTQNALIERFNGTYRREVLDAHVFENLHHARMISQQWLQHYNHYRPHSALNDLTSNEYFNLYQKKGGRHRLYSFHSNHTYQVRHFFYFFLTSNNCIEVLFVNAVKLPDLLCVQKTSQKFPSLFRSHSIVEHLLYCPRFF